MGFCPYSLSTWISFRFGELMGQVLRQLFGRKPPQPAQKTAWESRPFEDSDEYRDYPADPGSDVNLVVGSPPYRQGSRTNQNLSLPPGAVIASTRSFVRAYHAPHCECVEKIWPGNERWFQSHREAIEAGYRPCRWCRPDRMN